MIRHQARHHVTGRPVHTAECDTDGCPEAIYLPAAESGNDAIRYLRRLGWNIGRDADPYAPLPARCPAHAGAPQPEDEDAVSAFDRARADLARVVGERARAAGMALGRLGQGSARLAVDMTAFTEGMEGLRDTLARRDLDGAIGALADGYRIPGAEVPDA